MIGVLLTAHAHSMASATGALSALPQHPMTHLRVIFLIVLIVFFCSLFIGSYIWMRRPNFGQLKGRRGLAKATGTAVPGITTQEGTAEGQIRTVP